MKIRQKLVIEVIVLSAILAAGSFVVINNALLVAERFSDLNNELIPTLMLLKDMRQVASNVLTSTLEVAIIENEATSAGSVEYEVGQELNKINQDVDLARAQFDELFSSYKKHLDGDEMTSANEIEIQWEKFEINSDKFREYRMRGIADEEFVKLKDEFKDSKTALFKEIDSTIIENESMVREKRDEVSRIVENTTLTMLVTTIVAIIILLFVRIYILRSIFVPILRIRNLTRKIAAGNFKIRVKDSAKDEIGELADDINSMAHDLENSQEKLLKNEKLFVIGTLAARMAHDIRNPLAIIRGGIDNMKMRHDFEDKEKATLATINRAIDRITHQIQEVLDFVKMTPLKIEKASLLLILRQAVANLELPDKVRVEMPENDVSIECDQRKIEVALLNMFRNSLDAIEKSGYIKVRLIDINETVRIEIEDSGPGIPEEIQTKVFEPLFTTKQRGTGLGLTSVKNIVEEHGGSIVFSNNPTVFSIILPKESNAKEQAA